ncbi:MAG: hypothetical protein COV34_00925 [Candidatus Zambryskibacteria bacterium CG10_big_fil_rev_8_21_14_0_10_42_12]|uniref:Uncharacterized protein n=1 Tax=Candidatus Zambryskibacteria bacterium CG10_big_fil_rev_8_21_14_0_10_42_12 TaxID=1975115 RepID=A0A2H0QX38_9BACT|nr:MAG: hypothetical protein COV34_00925 [Candidatus Zambryskibacteria bacterium CG10_big_fil_rev_8_21_14_0_10_42_12]
MMKAISEALNRLIQAGTLRLLRSISGAIKQSPEVTTALQCQIEVLVSVNDTKTFRWDLTRLLRLQFAQHGRLVPVELMQIVSGENQEQQSTPQVAGNKLVPPIEKPLAKKKPLVDKVFDRWCTLLASAAAGERTPFEELKELTWHFLFEAPRDLTSEIWSDLVGAIFFIDTHRRALFASKDGARNIFRRMPVGILREAIFGQDGFLVRTNIMLDEIKKDSADVPPWVVAKTYFFLNALEALMERKVLDEMETGLVEQLIDSLIKQVRIQNLLDEAERVEGIRPKAKAVGERRIGWVDPEADKLRKEGKPVNSIMAEALVGVQAAFKPNGSPANHT